MTRRSGNQSVIIVDGLSVLITRKRIKNLHLRVKAPEGRVEVSAPFGTSQQFIEEFVRSKRAWIEKTKRGIEDSPRGEAESAGAREQAEWKAIVSAYVPLLIAKWEPILGVKVGKLAYRNMKSRWGSCQPATGRICINTRLALYPPECLEYVVVHELCHLRVHGHGPDFWSLVEAALPNWKDARKKLRQ